MEFIDDSSTSSQREEPPQPENLLEECWFFGNLLIDSKTKMSKSYSDLGLSSNYNTQEEMLVIRSGRSSSTTPKKHPKGDNFARRKLARAPSLPSSMEPKVDMFDQVKEKHDLGRRNSRHRNDLIRQPSLPPCIRRQQEDEDEESEFTLGRLIRQASLNSSHILPPRHISKAQSSIIPTKYRLIRKKTDQIESHNMDIGDQYLSEDTKMRRSSSDIQAREVQSLNNLSSKSGIEVWKPIVANKTRNVQENCKDKTKEKMVKSYSAATPKWCDNEKRSAEDMKAEIKFWARAVASNVGAPGLLANRN